MLSLDVRGVMNNIIGINQINNLNDQLKGKKVVLVGGCFDILHIGHITFLNNAKKNGDALIVLLESNQKVRELKGEGRPINIQKDRAEVLSALKSVDFIVLLPQITSNEEYNEIIKKINPNVIATTKGDSSLDYKERTANLVNAEVIEVTDYINEKSTTKLLSLLGNI